MRGGGAACQQENRLVSMAAKSATLAALERQVLASLNLQGSAADSLMR